MKRSGEEIFNITLSKRKSQTMYDTEWERFVKYSELPNEASVAEITEELVVQYLHFLRVELQLAPTTIWSSFSKINTHYVVNCNLEFEHLFSFNPINYC